MPVTTRMHHGFLYKIPFGIPHSANAPTAYQFTGKELDSTGLYYFAARYYDASVGRFITEDAWQGTRSQPESQNRYVYVVNNPLRYIDPTGNVFIDLKGMDAEVDQQLNLHLPEVEVVVKAVGHLLSRMMNLMLRSPRTQVSNLLGRKVVPPQRSMALKTFPRTPTSC